MYPKSRGIDSSRQLELDRRLIAGAAALFIGGVFLYAGILLSNWLRIITGAVFLLGGAAWIVHTMVLRRRARK